MPEDQAAPGAAFRAYFGVVGLFALWVGAWGYFVPAEVGRALPWSVPPLHARFIAAMYLAGLLAMACSLAARRLSAVRLPLVLASLWTGALFVVSLRHLGEFDFAKPQVWFWFGAYAVFPLWGAWLRVRSGARAAPRERIEPTLCAVGVVCLVLAASLFVAPGAMVLLWPWPVSPLLANIYAGPFFAWGVCAILLAREARAEARTIVLASMLTFTLLALLASGLHLKLFHFDAPAAWVWFLGLAIAGALVARQLLAARGA